MMDESFLSLLNPKFNNKKNFLFLKTFDMDPGRVNVNEISFLL